MDDAPIEPPAIPRRPLHDTAVERLREMVHAGDLEPGQKVPEKRLTAALGISRTPLREALKMLAAEGLIELLPNRGARVAAMTAQAVDEMFPVMGSLEALAGELACLRLTDTEFVEIRALHYQMALHHAKGELAPYFRLNQQIHEKILAASGNSLLITTYEGLAARIRHARYRADMTRDRWDQAMADHEEMLDALEQRDSVRLGHVLKRHLENKRQTVLDAIAKASGAP